MAMAFDNLRVETDGAVTSITVNRPKVRNALNTATLQELRAALHDIRQSSDVRAVVITGEGDQAFVAGADISELAQLTATSAHEHARAGQSVFDFVENLGKPVIAAINGWALGGGCELAMACTIRIAAEHAKLGQPEIGLGLIPGFGGTQRLTRLVGRGKALEMMLTGAPIGAAEAERIGLVNRVVPAAALLTEARSLAATLAEQPPLAVRAILEAVTVGTLSPEAGLTHEAALFGLVFGTEDMREGTRAFLEKRKPRFVGR